MANGNMWTSFWHLMWRSADYFPTTLSSNWLSILLPLLAYIATQGVRIYKQGWRTVSHHPIDLSAKILVAFYALLFAWAVIRTTYNDHMALVSSNRTLQEQLNHRRATGLTLRITDLRASSYGLNDSLIQIVLVASNNGEPTTARGWSLQITTSQKTSNARYVFAQDRIAGMADLPRLDDILQEPVGVLSDKPGYVSFLMPGLTTEQILALCDDSSAQLSVTATDSLDRSITAKRSIQEMCTQSKSRTSRIITEAR